MIVFDPVCACLKWGGDNPMILFHSRGLMFRSVRYNIIPVIQSSQLAEPLWTDPGIKSEIGVRELISTLKKKKKKAQAGNEWSNSLQQILASEDKPPPCRLS